MMDEYLASIYYDPKNSASYTGPTKLYRVVRAAGKKITLKQIREWLKGQEAYTLHRQARHRFPRNRVIVDGIDEQWDVDLMDMTNLSKYNGGVRYVLAAIDIFSRYAWFRPLKSKHGKEVVKAFQSVFAEGRIPEKIRTDRGTEFTNHLVQKYLKDQDVIHFVTNNEVKANYAERVIKTVKRKIFMYFTKKQTYQYADLLQDFATSYNNTHHRSIKMKPADVTEENEATLWDQQYAKPHGPEQHRKFKFDVADTVRISHLSRAFTREYEEKWTGEIFTVTRRFKRRGLPIYRLKDYLDEAVQGTFYEQELQLVKEPDVYRIEKILKTRKIKGKKQHLVKWAGWPSKYDSWIGDEELQDYR